MNYTKPEFIKARREQGESDPGKVTFGQTGAFLKRVSAGGMIRGIIAVQEYNYVLL